MPAKPLSTQQLEEAARLKAIFNAWKKNQADLGLPAAQEQLVEKLGFNQSSFSQYMNGRIPLNIEAAIKIAQVLGCQVSDFSPSIVEQIAEYARAVGMNPNAKEEVLSGDVGSLGKLEFLVKMDVIDQDEYALLREFRRSTERGKRDALNMMLVVQKIAPAAIDNQPQPSSLRPGGREG